MNKSRIVVLASTLVVGAGVLTAVGALYLDPAQAAVGPLPAAGLSLPADAQFVMGIDVRRFVASPFYTRFGDEHAAARPKAFAEMEEKTGINPERDVDAIYIAGRKGTGGKGHDGDGVVIVVGTFDRYKVSRAIETSHKGAASTKYNGTPLYLFEEKRAGHKAGAVAFLDDNTLVMGSRSAVEQTIDVRFGGGQGLRGNAPMTALLETVRPGSTFWMDGDQSVLGHMPKGIPAPGGDGQSMSLPPLKTVVVTGDLDPVVSFEATGEASDGAAAQSLADLVRGFVALASLQAHQKPELKQLAAGVSVTTDANKVRIAARFPYEVLESLRTKKTARGVEPATAVEPAR
jgi:hypothetical protein